MLGGCKNATSEPSVVSTRSEKARHGEAQVETPKKNDSSRNGGMDVAWKVQPLGIQELDEYPKGATSFLPWQSTGQHAQIED
jgi:hypothetical protein